MAEADTHAKKLEVMRDQFRARNAVYKCEKGSIPAIGKGTEVEESERVEREVRALVEKELPGKKGCPLPLTLRTAHDAPTAEALKQDWQHTPAWGFSDFSFPSKAPSAVPSLSSIFIESIFVFIFK